MTLNRARFPAGVSLPGRHSAARFFPWLDAQACRSPAYMLWHTTGGLPCDWYELNAGLCPPRIQTTPMATDPLLQLIQPARALRHAQHAQIFHPVSVAPPRDILRYLSEDVASAAALFLGCGDASCLLASMAVEHPGLQQLTAVLHDDNIAMLARAAIILLLCAELDPDSQEDMLVLWEVWYCTLWGSGTWLRVQPFVERLAKGGVPWLETVRADDAAALQRVWQGWLSMKNKQSSGRLLKQWGSMSKEKKAGDVSGGAATGSKQEATQLALAVQMAVKLGSLDPLLDGLRIKYKELQGILQQDLTTWFRTGSSPPGYTGHHARAARMANITFFEPVSGWRSPHNNHPAMAWGPFTASELESAFKSGSPAGVLARACIARITQTVRSFQAHTVFGSMATSAAAGSSNNSDNVIGNKVRLHVQLTCVDALQLCLGMPLSTPACPAVASDLESKSTASTTGTTPGSAQCRNKKGAKLKSAVSATASVPAAPLLFHAIETGTLLDDVGLLALLVAAAPRLAPGGHLYTSSHKWYQTDYEYVVLEEGTYTLKHFLNKALCVPLSLTPTILGVRLLTDLARDRPETPDAQDYIYRTDAFRELVWAPIPAELRASPLPQLQPQAFTGPEGSLEQTLKSVQEQVCCRGFITEAGGLMGWVRGTPQLLAWLLASMIQRVDMSALLCDGNSSGTAATPDTRTGHSCSSTAQAGNTAQGMGTGSSQDASVQASYATTQRLLWALRTKVAPLLPISEQLTFKVGIDILRSSLQQNAPQAWLPADVPACPGLVQLDVTVPQNCKDTGMPRHALHVTLVDRSDPAVQQAIATQSVGRERAGMHIIDCFSMGSEYRISLFLPTDHGFSLKNTHVVGYGLHPGRITLRPSQPQVVHAPCTLAQVLLPSACTTAKQHSHQQQMQGQQQQHRQGQTQHADCMDAEWALQVCSQTEDACYYRAVLRLQRLPVRSGSTTDVSTPGGTTDGSMPGSTTDGSMLGPIMDVKVEVDVQDAQDQDARGQGSAQAWAWCPTSQRLLVSLTGATNVQPCEVVLPWPVLVSTIKTDINGIDSYSSDTRVTFSQAEQLQLCLRKAQEWLPWPSDEHWPGAARPLDLAHLASVGSDMAKPIIHECIHAEATLRHVLSQDWELSMNPLPGAVENVCDMVNSFMEKALDNPMPEDAALYVLTSGPEEGVSGSECAEILLAVCAPVLKTEAGRLLLPVAVYDLRFSSGGVCPTVEAQTVPVKHMIKRTNEEIEVMRRMLQRNAVACQPTAAQAANLRPEDNKIPFVYSSYVSFTHHRKPIAELYLERKHAAKKVAAYKPLTAQGEYVVNRIKELFATTVGDDELQAAAFQEICTLLQQHPGVWKSMPGEVRVKVGWLLMAEIKKMVEETPDPAQTASHEGSKHGGACTHSNGSCARCGHEGCKLLKCGKCGAVQYCSKDCQVAHWKQHRPVCMQ